MISKKKIFAIVIFIVIGLFMFSFANPAEVDGDITPVGGEEKQVDKTNLEDAINRGKGLLDNLNETNDLSNKLEEAIKNGEEFLKDEDATQTDVDDATKEIEDAIKDLEEEIKNNAAVNAQITLLKNTNAPAKSVNLTTTIVVDNPANVLQVKLVQGTNCAVHGTNLVLVNNNAEVTVENNAVYTACMYLTDGTVRTATNTVNNIDKTAPVIE